MNQLQPSAGVPHWNTVCTIDAIAKPAIIEALNTMGPRNYNTSTEPIQYLHRKCWEEAMTWLALHHFGAVRPDSQILAVAAGREMNIFALTNEVRWVFATDIYGDGDFAEREAQGGMLRDPIAHAHGAVEPWRPGRLVVEHMNALSLRIENDTFDGAFSQSSIEHMGGFPGAVQAIREMARVVRPGGVVAVATECCVSGHPAFEQDHFSIFSPEQFKQMAYCAPELEPVDEFVLPPSTAFSQDLVINLDEEVQRINTGRPGTLPHVLLEHQGRIFTSGFLVWRKLG